MQKEKRKTNFRLCFLLSSFFFFLSSCSFDYGENETIGDNLPNLIMRDVEYVRVVSSDPLLRFRADYAEQYEQQGLMKLEVFSFEQFSDNGREINAQGRAGRASVNTESGDVFMDEGVNIEVNSEDIMIITHQLEWKDEERLLLTGDDEEVNIQQQNGTSFFGIGFRADARRRSWEFTGPVSGVYVLDEDEEYNP